MQQIRDLIARISAYTAGGRVAFFSDTMVQDAVLRNVEVIGEAVKNLSQDFRDAHADVPWRAIASMRDRLIHGFAQVNLETVWLVVERDIPDLRTKVTAFLAAIPPESSHRP